MAIEVQVLGSGSKGNTTLIKNGDTKILLDCGLNVRVIIERLKAVGITLNEISAVCITHEHTDHIASASELGDAYNIPVYANKLTAQAIKRRVGVKNVIEYGTPTDSFGIGSIDITPFAISHDAVCPVGYKFMDRDSSFLYATDLGYVNEDVMRLSQGADVVMIESNHDRNMLINGHYPQYLKERILSNKGHLSNETCAMTIQKMLERGTKSFILGHISEENNLPELAFWQTTTALDKIGASIDKDYKLVVSMQREVSERVKAK
ncbi:MAG: MBL fold metallo-hydrolase [Clostridia bacterium]|nr:MBL fold metallo-hydrolase [Clostridia bacterium]